MIQFKVAALKYFSHKTFKNFFKRVRYLGWSVDMVYYLDNSIGLPEYIIGVNIRLKTLEHEFWDNNATHHYIINGKYSIDIPCDAYSAEDPSQFKYIWQDGPTNYISFSSKKLKNLKQD